MPNRLAYSRLSKEASNTAELYSARLEKMQMPVAASDGNSYHFDQVSEAVMRDAIALLAQNGGTVDWRHSGGATSYDTSGLQTLFDELRLSRAARGAQIDQEYLALKAQAAAGNLSRKAVKDWLEA